MYQPFSMELISNPGNIIFIQKMCFLRNNIHATDCDSAYETCKSYDVETKYKLAYTITDKLIIYETDVPKNFDPTCGNYLRLSIEYIYFSNTSSLKLNAEANNPTINSGNFFIVADSSDPNPSFRKVDVTISKSNYQANVRLLEIYARDVRNSTCCCTVNITASGMNYSTCVGPKFNDAYNVENLISPFSIIVSRNGNQIQRLKIWLWVETTTTTTSTTTTSTTTTSTTATSTTTTSTNATATTTSTPAATSSHPTESETFPSQSVLSREAKIGAGVGVGVGGSLLLVTAFLLAMYCLKRKKPKVTEESSVKYDNNNNSKSSDEFYDNSTDNAYDYDASPNMEPTISVHPSFTNKFPMSPVNESNYDSGKDKVNKYKALRQKSKNKKPLMNITQNFMQDSEIYYPLDDSTGSPNLQLYNKSTKSSSGLKRISVELDYRRSLTDDGDDGQIWQVPSPSIHYKPGKQHFKKNNKSSKQLNLTNKEKVKKAKSVTFNLAGNYPQQMSYNGSFANANDPNADSTGRDIDGNLLF
ncbi:hypothetical protein HELRODRAFT_170504 [Helobdella robusta]|uniref:Mid2 domain-containing protein n=1 Tax=Helobdella robusta TaxID=6412 RepID=T1F351_HELRO|nr:hypothetical protein HELRODRAFT_170504 [Helobdella robusta]ESO07193.1 hypothetical protein HELRODRAFT_170504 [Helobdella robusta]